jgi:hypothetical protein
LVCDFISYFHIDSLPACAECFFAITSGFWLRSQLLQGTRF